MYEDKTLVCKECGAEFVFTAGEQEFYAERGFQNEPQRCKACRDARKNAARGPREYFTAVCASCGGEARVPFEPKTDRPVYCSECFAKMRENGLILPAKPEPASRWGARFFTLPCRRVAADSSVWLARSVCRAESRTCRFSAPCGMLCLSKLQTIGFCVIILHFFRHIGR